MLIKTPILKDKFIHYGLKSNEWRYILISPHRSTILDPVLHFTIGHLNSQENSVYFAPVSDNYYWVGNVWKNFDPNNQFSDLVEELTPFLLFI